MSVTPLQIAYRMFALIHLESLVCTLTFTPI